MPFEQSFTRFPVQPVLFNFDHTCVCIVWSKALALLYGEWHRLGNNDVTHSITITKEKNKRSIKKHCGYHNAPGSRK